MVSITRWFLFFHLLIFQISSQEQLRLEPLPVVAPSGEEGGQDIDLELFQHHDDEDPGLLHVIQRYLMGSNCVMIEKGTAPPYEKCYGCEIQRAMNCLSDLRTNVTGNVPSGCKLNSLNSNYDTTCCPVYVQKKRKIFLRFETSGYPSALSCLRKVGCQATQIYDDLYAECAEVCKDNIQEDIFLTCTAIGSPASLIKLDPLLLSLSLCLVAALLGSDYLM